MAKRLTRLPPVHPGEVLRADLMEPLGLSINRLARKLRVPASRIRSLVHGRRAVTADTALRLARYFNATPAFWLNLQVAYDLAVTTHAAARAIAREVQPRGPGRIGNFLRATTGS